MSIVHYYICNKSFILYSRKLFFTTYIRHGRFTYGQIENTKEFTASVLLERTPKVSKKIVYIGSRSGRDINKLADCILTLTEEIEVNSPAIKEIPITLECKVIYSQEQKIDKIHAKLNEQFYQQNIDSAAPTANKDYHTIYYGEIINAYYCFSDTFEICF